MAIQVLAHASELITGSGVRVKDGRRILESDLGVIPDGALVYQDKQAHGKAVPSKILWVGKTSELPKKYVKAKRKNLKNRFCLTPGLVDCHNHLIFSGNRSEEFAARCAGATYQEIAARGGGIQSTVKATRNASRAQLEALACERLKELKQVGVRTVEIKSGYGLSHESELKILSIIPKLRKQFPELKLTSTYLGAHAFPQDMERQSYLAEMLTKTLPEVARKKLADACDVFIDEGYFTLQEGREILQKAKALGLKIKIHADELVNTEAATLAAELDALSADHLLKISDRGIKSISKSQTVAVLLPGTAFYLKASHAPARKLLDAGACVAIATDFNPGTCMTLSLPSVMTIAALYLGMSRAELFASVTYNAAKALGLHSHQGTLEPGKAALFTVHPFSRFEELYYRFAWTASAI